MSKDDSTAVPSKQSAPIEVRGTPWKCRPITPFIDCIDDFGLFKIEPVVAGQTIGDFIDGEDAIARRVAACLNACAGFTTPDLEGGIRDKRHRHEIIADLVAAIKQRDELTEALRKIVLLDNDAHPGLSTWHDMRVRAHKAAEAAIAKLNTGETA